MPKEMQNEILSNYKYIFIGEKDYQPFMKVVDLKNYTNINNINIETFKHNHGAIDAQTFRIDNFAYSTDIKKFYNNDIDKLKNLDLWIVGLLRPDSHPSHCGFEEIIEYVKYLKPKKTIFTHMTALVDEIYINNKSPENVSAGFDGMEFIL